MQRERRRDPYPWTWEIPAAVALATLFVNVIGIQLGRSVANLVAGAGWTWPDANAGAFPSPIGTAFWTSLPGVLGGHADAGLPSPAPDGLAGRGLVWVSLALTEVALLTATVWLGAWAYQRWGPGRMRGMATAAEAEKLLGVTRLRKVAGIDVNIVTYRTSPDILAALIRGEVDVAIESPTAFSGALENNQAKLLAVTGSQRNPTYPDVPTAQEAGVEGYEVVGWNALYTLAGTPDDIIKKLNDAMFEVAGMPEIQKRFMELGTSARALTPDEMAAQFEKDRARWAEVIESAGIEKR